MSSGDRFYLMEFRNRPVYKGDIGSLLRVQGLIVGGGGALAHLYLPGALDPAQVGHVHELTVEEWSDYIQRSDDPEILTGPPKIFLRKLRFDISSAVQQKIWRADGYRCMYCNSEFGNRVMTIDHFIPLEEGGANNHTNYLSSCRPCNKDKANEHPATWLPRKARAHDYNWFVDYLKQRRLP